MDIQTITSQLIDYLEGNLTDEQMKSVEIQVQQSEIWRKTLTNLQALEQLMEAVPMVQPSKNLNLRFQQLLQEEKQKMVLTPSPKTRNIYTLEWKKALQIAAAIILLILGTGIGIQWKNNQGQEQEIASLKKKILETQKLLALSMMDQSSASDRIKGVNISLKNIEADERILEALINRMNLDANINVRLKAIEALASFEKNNKVIVALIKALQNQQSPEVQIAIIEVLTDLRAKDAVHPFQQLLQDQRTMEVVKTKAASGIEALL